MMVRTLAENAVRQIQVSAGLLQQREQTQAAIASNRPLDAELDSDRRLGWVARLVGTDKAIAADIIQRKPGILESLDPEKRGAAERVQGGTIDFVPANFLIRGARAARAVARVVDSQGNALGTGFVAAPGVFITNQHVLRDKHEASAARIEFDYELAEDKGVKPITRFSLSPDDLFLSSPEDDLDFSLAAIGDRELGEANLADFGYCPLLDRQDKHARAVFVNVVQHPDGRPKELSLRENRITAQDERVLLYEADTLPGSSGSPVFNDFWEVIAIHHYGAPSSPTVAIGTVSSTTEANEGIRVSAILTDLRGRASEPESPRGKELLKSLFEVTKTPLGADEIARRHAATPGVSTDPLLQGVRTDNGASDIAFAGQVAVPFEVFVRVDPDASRTRRLLLSGEPELGEKIAVDDDYSNRRGYDPDFLGVNLPLPVVTQDHDAIAKLKNGRGESELKYQHFSIVMNRHTRLAFFTAVNINGATWIDIDRNTGRPKSEAKEKWFIDPRIDEAAQISQKHFDQISYLFDRGHLVRRSDPTWGNDRKAIRANADTFHFTNCSPQHWKFNQQVKYWQGIEMYLLERGAVEDEERLAVFSGPLFEQGRDPVIEGLIIPARYWKIAVQVRGGKLVSSGFVADQADIVHDPRERFPTALTLERSVKEWRYAISKIEKLTGLSFGAITVADSFDSVSESMDGCYRRPMKNFADAL